MKNIKVSFILAIYNAERTILECLNSIYAQDYSKKDYEVIVIDGGSNDKTLEIINKFKEKQSNLTLLNNPHKLSEGRGMGKDQGVLRSKGEFLVFLDHDNILMDKDWLNKMLYPFKNKEIMATQSFLDFKKDDPLFLKYVNAIGVEDAFAIPYSLVSQATLSPKKFKLVENKYYLHKLDSKKVLFLGANGCIFRRGVFKKIKGYTRDVNVSASMADYGMKVAMVVGARVHHKTGASFFKFFKKKAIYFYRFINKSYEEENFKWVPASFVGKVHFSLMILANLTIVLPLLYGLKKLIQTREIFWLLHPLYLFSMTALYGFVTLLKIKNYFKYISKS